MSTRSILIAAICLAAAVPMAAGAQRLSLAERVAALEQRVAAQAANPVNDEMLVDLVRRNQDLQREVAELRAQSEQLRFELENLKRAQVAAASRRPVERSLRPTPDGVFGPVEPNAELRADAAIGDADTAAFDDPLAFEEPEVRLDIDAQTETTAIAGGALPASEPLGPLTDPVAEREAYDLAFVDLRNGRYEAAARGFDRFLKQYPESEQAANALYWLGESHYVTKNYRTALTAFNQVIERFPSSSKVPEARLKVGYVHFDLREWDAARKAFEDVIRLYSNATVAKLAQNRLRAVESNQSR